MEKLFFYIYNFNIYGDINEPTEIIINNMNIQDKIIRCQINSNSTFIICLYYSILSEQKLFASTIFNIEQNNIFSGVTNVNKYVTNNIIEIKVVSSLNDNFFVCYIVDGVIYCFINDNLYNFYKINCTYTRGWSTEFKVLFFKEQDEFMLISRRQLYATIINNSDKSVKKCDKPILSVQPNDNSIIYINDYQVVNYTNFQKENESIDISILDKNKFSKYIEEIKNLFDNSVTKEELIINFNKFIYNITSINYINDNRELIIVGDENTITFTSTYIQEINENSNVTIINLGECEYKLKQFYNISKESYLYIFKLDKKQKGKNYHQIEYEIFYPLNGENLELLNLSICKGIDIEISIPLKINDTIDKYNPKSNYYNNICTKTTSKSNTDITLKDRRNEFIKNNMSLCEDNCELVDYDNDKKRVKCSCKTKALFSLDNIELDTKNILKNFIDLKTITNIEIVKCYKNVFNKKNIMNNYGFIIFIFIIIIYFICTFIFYCKSKKKLFDVIIKIVKAKSQENQINKNKKINIINNKNWNRTKKIKFINELKLDSTSKRLKNNNHIMFLKNNKRNIKFKEINRKVDNTSKRKINILDYTETELNALSYKEALKIDKRSYIQYYCSLLKKKQIILFSFYPNKDYNSQIIKSFLFFFFCISDIAVNALFFTDDTMHKIYTDSGSFDLNYQLPQIIYSFLISSAINFIIEYLSLSEDAIISIKGKKNINLNISKRTISRMKVKFGIFFIISFILLVCFGYYISCFCCIYENTQIHLLKDSLISFGISLINPIFINLIPGIFRIVALRSKKVNKEWKIKTKIN